MFTVYKITNLKNQKCYIGSSIRVQKRWKQHINTSKNPNSTQYNYPLYQAFRQDGIENFAFEVLRDDFNTQEEMQQYEYDMIILFNSVINGYNQTYQTSQIKIQNENFQKSLQKRSQKCAKINIEGHIIETYSSYHEAARKNAPNTDGDNYATLIRNVCKGINNGFQEEIYRDLDENNNIIFYPIKNYNGKKKIIGINLNNPDDILYFNSISEAAQKLPAERKSLSACVNGKNKYSNVKGYVWREIDNYGNIIEHNNDLTLDKAIDNYNQKNPLINGERHNIKEWCKIFDISPASVYQRVKKGMTIEQAITMPKRR